MTDEQLELIKTVLDEAGALRSLTDGQLEAFFQEARGDVSGAIYLGALAKGGFDIEMLSAIASVTSIPIIASGGAGNIQHFIDLFTSCPSVDAGLAASIFHLKEVAIEDLKNAMAERGIPARRLQHV